MTCSHASLGHHECGTFGLHLECKCIKCGYTYVNKEVNPTQLANWLRDYARFRPSEWKRIQIIIDEGHIAGTNGKNGGGR